MLPPAKTELQQMNFPFSRGKRLAISLPIQVSGFDNTGRMFHDQTVTSDISENGCRFNLLREVQPKEVLAVQLIQPAQGDICENRPMLFEVVWVQPSEHGWTVGAEQIRREDIWRNEFSGK